MNIFLTQFLEKKEPYESHENVKIIVRVFDYNKKRYNISIGVLVSFGKWIVSVNLSYHLNFENPVKEIEDVFLYVSYKN